MFLFNLNPTKSRKYDCWLLIKNNSRTRKFAVLFVRYKLRNLTRTFTVPKLTKQWSPNENRPKQLNPTIDTHQNLIFKQLEPKWSPRWRPPTFHSSRYIKSHKTSLASSELIKDRDSEAPTAERHEKNAVQKGIWRRRLSRKNSQWRNRVWPERPFLVRLTCLRRSFERKTPMDKSVTGRIC